MINKRNYTSPQLQWVGFLRFFIVEARQAARGFQGTFVGLDEIKNQYFWQAKWKVGSDVVFSNNWESTKESLKELSKRLKAALDSKEPVQLRATIKAVFEWAGIRNANVGAGKFVTKKDNLVAYFENTSGSLVLNQAELNDDLHLISDNPPILMNAMLTKVYALLSNDGLPIYDSRVAGAIATLVDIWLCQNNIAPENLSNLLKFKATDRRQDRRTFINPDLHGVIGRQNNGYGTPTQDWVSAKIRLGWILHGVLDKNCDLFVGEETKETKMHAFEAALFMIGYNTGCLRRWHME